MPSNKSHPILLVAGVVLLAYIFANVEIQIEGDKGWAAGLPVTFRVEQHWLLDIFWGGRAMTGYHAYIFPFMFLFFQFPMLMFWQWTLKLQARGLACVMFFWVAEDVLWFILNPAFGWAKLTPAGVPWHKHWVLGLPTDYWTFTAVAGVLFWYSFTSRFTAKAQSTQRTDI